MSSIVTCLIVRDEAHVIRRCLDSVKPFTDFLVIHDTGSTDDTPKVIEDWMTANDIEGEIHFREWSDFATNRTMLIESARKLPYDYVLTLDADEQLQRGCCFDKENLSEQLDSDCHEITCNDGVVSYPRPLLFRNALPWRYKGVVHEGLYCDMSHSNGDVIKGLTVKVTCDGARSKAGDKHLMAIESLKHALMTNREPEMKARYLFYLAQSYRDAAMPREALETYNLREKEGGWKDEVFQAIYQQAKLMEWLKFRSYMVIQKYLQAWEVMPTRAESLHGAARICNQTQRWQQAYVLASAAAQIAKPQGLFIEDWIYDHGILDELAIAAHYAGHHKEARQINLTLLKLIPECHRERIRKNLSFCGG